MARPNNINMAPGGGGGSSRITLGSPESRARLAVARNKATLAEKKRAAKNTAIKKIVTKKTK